MSCDKLSSAKMLLPAGQPCKTHCIYVEYRLHAVHESAKPPPAGQPWQDRHSLAPRVSVRFLHQLNELQDGLLMAGAADGAVRVWRNYTVKGSHSLATAFQVGLQQQHDRDCQH